MYKINNNNNNNALQRNNFHIQNVYFIFMATNLVNCS